MKSLVLDEDERLIAQSAEAFFADQGPIQQLRALRDKPGGESFDRNTWRAASEMGFAGLLIPERYGGAGLDVFAAGLISYAIGRNLSRTPFLSTAVLSAAALSASESDEIKKLLLPKMAAAEIIVSTAFDERSRHTPSVVDTMARETDIGYVLNGRKIFVLDGNSADWIIASARLGSSADPEARSGKIAVFLINPSTAGVALTPRTLVDGSNVADLSLIDVVVPAEAMLMGPEQATNVVEHILDIGRACLAAEALGVAEEVFDRVIEYLKQREQFGVKIGTFQALQHRASAMFCDLQLARSTVLAALRGIEQGADDASYLTSLAAAKTGEVGRRVTDEGVHMHGGIGMTDEFDIGLFMKRMRAVDLTFGDSTFHLDRMAALSGF